MKHGWVHHLQQEVVEVGLVESVVVLRDRGHQLLELLLEVRVVLHLVDDALRLLEEVLQLAVG